MHNKKLEAKSASKQTSFFQSAFYSIFSSKTSTFNRFTLFLMFFFPLVFIVHISGQIQNIGWPIIGVLAIIHFQVYLMSSSISAFIRAS